MSGRQFRCVIVGDGSLTVHAAQSLLAGGHTLVAAVTDEPAVEGVCRRHDVPVMRFSRHLAEQLAAEPFDILFSVVNLRLLPEDVLALPREMAINFHDGPLPDWAGVNVTTWALLRDRPAHGVTWHLMQGEADTGDILVQAPVDIADDETSFSLNAKCYAAGMATFDDLLAQLEAGTWRKTAQDASARHYFDFYDRPAHGGALDFAASAADIARTVRALDFGAGYENPLASAKVVTAHGAVLVGQAAPAPGQGAPGTLLEVQRDGIVVAAGDGAVALTKLRNVYGRTLDGAGVLAALQVAVGANLTAPDAAGLEATVRAVARSEGFFRRRLLTATDDNLVLSGTQAAAPGARRGQAPVALPAVDTPDAAAGALCAALGRLTGRARYLVAVSTDDLAAAADGQGGLLSSWVPHRPQGGLDQPLASWTKAAEAQLPALRARGTFLRDLVARTPGLAAHRDGLRLGVQLHLGAGPAPDTGAPVVFCIDPAGAVTVEVAERTGGVTASELAARVSTFAAAAARGGAVSSIDIVTAEERAFLLGEVNDTARDVPRSDTLDAAFARQVQKTPDAPALTVGGETLSYAQLAARSRGVAQALMARDVGPGHRVGIYVERSADMMVAVLGTLMAGAAYTPLDPAYPAQRVAYMIEDAKLSAILVHPRSAGRLSGHEDVLLDVAGCAPQDDAVAARATGRDLAYVIYTSGSTGKPKGVMVEHHNVVNFFAAMDEVIAPSTPRRWLAVTSLNFDISVLELLYTLTRGFEVVLYQDAERAGTAMGESAARGPAIDFSLFYFSADEGEAGDKYRLLIEGAKFGDAHGFCAVWTPERHFHAFGGLYPNPSVTGAALAMVTQNVQIRSGSCVSPLHSPIRIAEEWSVVDNLSGGRVGLSFAAGWQPNDFAIRPHAFKDRKDQMLRDIDTVKRLWRGEAVEFADGTGKNIEVRTLPRPIQDELPVWVTAAGNPETFRAAGERGANLLTHLLGQTLEELDEKIRVYREAYAAAGHPGRGVVSLMLHTYVGETDDESRETAREPMKQYLKSAVGLVQKAAWSFPTFKKSTTLDDGTFSTSHLSDEEMDALLSFSFERYFDTSGLFGSVETATAFAHQVAQIDADEIACLIDFGVPTDKVLAQLPRLAEVLRRQKASAASAPTGSEAGLGVTHASAAELMQRHGVTHVQCTPSMARMWMADDATRQALGQVGQILIGGEAFPAPLARDLLSVNDNVHNMYGPTETTIWSSTHQVEPRVPSVPIGRPIANTEMYILDDNRRLLPPGTPGELYIGGRGVVRGYFERPELTDERFVPNPFGEGRLYRTGDVAQVRADGVFEFLGRADDQVKIRGHRIELGEIETALSGHPSVSAAVVIARDDDGTGPRLVGYVIGKGAADPDPVALRDHLRQSLPEHMVPADFVTLDAFPHTPNKKIDKKALPAPKRAGPRRARTAPPEGETEEVLARIWSSVLGLDQVGVDENFFDLGGHSLQTVEVLVQVKKELSPEVSLVDLFRYPTIRALAQALAKSGDTPSAATAGQKRAEARMRRRNQRRRGA